MNPSLRRYLQPDRRSPRTVYWDNMPRAGQDPLATLLDIDMDNYLPEYILRKADLCTMAHGLELRVPLLDHRLYQTVLALPPSQRFTTPAKRALAPACGVCDELRLFNQKKRGFNPPLAPWLRVELASYLNGLEARLEAVTQGQLQAARVAHLVNEFRAGRDARAEQILQLIILDVSLRQLIHGPHRVH
jgi:asparagine synthase (glutamine-hydrolysing)